MSTPPDPLCPCPAPFNLAAHVLRHAQSQPDKIALAVLGLSRSDRWSYDRLARAVFGLAAALRAGACAGRRLLMRLGNTVAFPITYLGAIAADLVPVPTASQLTASEITRLCEDIAPALVVAAPDLALPTRCPVR